MISSLIFSPDIAQDEKSSVVWGMPLEAIKLGAVDDVLPLQSIAGRVLELVHGKPGGGKETGSPLKKSSNNKVSDPKDKGQKDSS